MVRLTLGAAVLASTFASSAAMADPIGAGGGVDWSRVVSDIEALTRRGADVLDSPRCTPAGCQTDTNATAARPERGLRLDGQQTANDWFGFKPTVSLVARDWGSSFRVVGDRLALIDALRLTSSTRMILARVRLTDARVAPFAQVGLGQWRTDPYILPLTPRYEEIAAQAAAGVEVRIKGTWQIALESTGTVLHREHGDANLPSAHMWSSTFASRVEF
jgi:hypothetical protein